MRIITCINAKGGCGKSTLAMNLAAGLAALYGRRTLLLDMDPQAQVTQWLGAGDGLTPAGTVVAALTGEQALPEVVQPTRIPGLSFVAAAEGLEELGRRITDYDDYPTLLSRLLQQPGLPDVDFVVIDSPNQISPVMENVILPADLFVVPFESTKAVRSYANLYKLLLKLRGGGGGGRDTDGAAEGGVGPDLRILHVLNNLSRLPGLRRRVRHVMAAEGLTPARTEVRSDGWLAQVDEHGGSIFHFRPSSRGAADLAGLVDEVLEALDSAPAPLPTIQLGSGAGLDPLSTNSRGHAVDAPAGAAGEPAAEAVITEHV